MTLLTTDHIAKRIPHRYQNLLLDEAQASSDDASTFKLTISDNDPMERHLFFYEWNNQTCLPTPLLAEISALACIVSAGIIKPGTFAYFAAITQFTIQGNPFVGTDSIIGQTHKISSKNGFHKHAFSISNDTASATGNLMAYYDTMGDTPSTPLPPVNIPPAIANAQSSPPTSIPAYAFKNPHMTFIDGYYLITPEDALYGYTYPHDHPLIRGHFPENPVMMGVCQWQMVDDAFTHFLTHTPSTAPQWQLDALIIADNQTAVCELKNVQLSVIDGQHGPQASTTSVKKVMFKQRVSPGEKLFIYLFNIQPIAA
ncbi:MAG: hypothetical protein ACO3K7_02885 [Candidatus Marinamargulisbacteria bacterium]